ncbi:unnamed protein product, partial [Rotaria socialis]
MNNLPKPLWDPRPLTPTNMNNQQQRQQQESTIRRTKLYRRRCHGNRKLRRFKNKCRQRGMNKEEIQRLIQDRCQQQEQQIDFRMDETNDDIELHQPITTTTITKSKRIIEKRMKMKMVLKKFNNRLPIYLKKAPNILIQNLSLQLQQKITNKKQQRYLYHRLQLLDQLHRIDQYRYLWQSYLNLGSTSNLWPIHIQKKMKSKNIESCVQYIEHHLNELEQQYHQATNELNEQAKSCPIKLKPFDILNQKLKEFVQLQRTRFTEKLNIQLTRHKNYIHENELYQTVLHHIHTDEQKSMIDQLIYIRERQLEIFENYLRLETRISMQCLPKELNRIENIITSIRYRPRFRNFLSIQFQQQQYKLIQEAKRNCLNMFLHAYEIQYQHYENHKHVFLKEFQCKNNTCSNETSLLECFLIYINYRIDRLKQVLYYERIPIFRRKLRRQRQHLKRKGKFLKQIQVSPYVILDLQRHPFTTTELKYLSRGPTYIRPNQSTLCPMKQRHKQIQVELNDMLSKIKNGLGNTTRDGYPSISKTASVYKLYEDRLRTCLTCQYMKSLPFIDQLRAGKELKWIKSIRRKLKRYKLILRRTDKSGVFHIGHMRDYEQKAHSYRKTTDAYEELSTNPLNDIYRRVIGLLNQLRSQNQIREWQKQKLIPVQNKIELAYMYFLPK